MVDKSINKYIVCAYILTGCSGLSTWFGCYQITDFFSGFIGNPSPISHRAFATIFTFTIIGIIGSFIYDNFKIQDYTSHSNNKNLQEERVVFSTFFMLVLIFTVSLSVIFSLNGYTQAYSNYKKRQLADRFELDLSIHDSRLSQITKMNAEIIRKAHEISPKLQKKLKNHEALKDQVETLSKDIKKSALQKNKLDYKIQKDNNYAQLQKLNSYKKSVNQLQQDDMRDSIRAEAQLRDIDTCCNAIQKFNIYKDSEVDVYVNCYNKLRGIILDYYEDTEIDIDIDFLPKDIQNLYNLERQLQSYKGFSSIFSIGKVFFSQKGEDVRDIFIYIVLLTIMGDIVPILMSFRSRDVGSLKSSFRSAVALFKDICQEISQVSLIPTLTSAAMGFLFISDPTLISNQNDHLKRIYQTIVQLITILFALLIFILLLNLMTEQLFEFLKTIKIQLQKIY